MDLATLTPGRPDTCPHLASYLAQTGTLPHCRIELYPGKPVPGHVERFAVVKLMPHLYRTVVLFRPGYPGGLGLWGMDGDLSDCARGLRVQRIPVLRVSAPPRQ